jgi:hypothetical protein
MIYRIRRNYLRLVVPLTLVLLAGAAALFWVTRLGALYAFKAPVELSSLSEDELEGSYVTVRVDELGDTFSYYGYTGEDGEKVVIERYCVYPIGDKFLTVRVTGKELSLLSDYDNAKDMVASGRLGSMKEYNAGTLTGTITAGLDAKVYNLLCTWIKDNYLADKGGDAARNAVLSSFGIPGSSAGEDGGSDEDYSSYYKEAIIPLQLETGYYGIMPRNKVIILTVFALLLLAAALGLLISLALGLWEKPLRSCLKRAGGRELLEDYGAGADCTRALRIGDKHIWWFKGLITQIEDIDGIIWAYPRSRRLEGGKLDWYLVLKTQDGRELGVRLGESAAVQTAIDLLKGKGHPLATGYDKEKQKLYERDIPTFKARVKNGTI